MNNRRIASELLFLAKSLVCSRTTSIRDLRSGDLVLDRSKKMIYRINARPQKMIDGSYEVGFSDAQTADTLQNVSLPIKVLKGPIGKTFEVVNND